MFQAKGLSIQVAFLYDLISGNWAWPARKPQRSMALVLMQTMPTSHPVLSGHPPSEEACKWMWLCPQIGQRKHNSLSWVQKMCITTVYTIISNIHVPTNESIPAQCSVLIYIYIQLYIHISRGLTFARNAREFNAGLQSAVLFPCGFFRHCKHAKY